MFEGIAIPSTPYRDETWSMGVAEKKKLNVMEMMCLRSTCQVIHMDRLRNEVWRRTGVTRVGWLSKTKCIDVVWIYEENGGGLVGEKRNGIWCIRCEVDRKAMNGVDGQWQEYWMKEKSLWSIEGWLCMI